MEEYTIPYHTRDGDGNDIEKYVKIKRFHVQKADFTCPCCRQHHEDGIPVRDNVSSNFTDWAITGEFVCTRCADLFSLYFYNYVVDANGIHLYNVRELRDQLLADHPVPYLFIITTSQKKHLFYRAMWNYGGEKFAVNLETETIYTSRKRMRLLFDFVEALQTLGSSKERLKKGEIQFDVLCKTGLPALQFLQKELKSSREIQIPLYCGQKRDMTEDEALCYINSTQTA